MLYQRETLALLSVPGIGRKTAFDVLRTAHHGANTADEMRDLLTDAKQKIPRLPLPSHDQIVAAFSKADEIRDKASELGVRILSLDDPNYPESLRTIPDPPVVLYVKGSIECLSAGLRVAVVGTREPTPWGLKCAERLGERFSQAGFTVVSGLAKGCDTAAHQGCLKERGITVAVMAHGLQMVYPAENRDLANDIVSIGGCLVSEYPPGVRGMSSFFIERDRLQSGLSLAVVVVETDIKGGTMHTVRACQEQGRILACVDHPQRLRHEAKVQGNRMLIDTLGAVALGKREDIDDLIDQLRAPGDSSKGKTKIAPTTKTDESLFDLGE